jgi:anti-anti-sigma regulatory factor
MLRITYDAATATLRLEGRIVGPWVAELRRAYVEHIGLTGTLTIDLRDVTFIDRAGVAFFDDSYPAVTLVNCSLFAVEQLKAVHERHEGVRT